MLSQVRKKKLLEYLDRVSVATVKQLVEFLDSSPSTIRRDITELDSQGKLKKIHNGAERIAPVESDDDRQLTELFPNTFDYSDREESERIAEQAVALCQNKESIYVGTGPNAYLMSHYLQGKNIQVYSNAVPFLLKMLAESYPHLIALGGQYIESQGIFVSPPSNLNFQGRYLFVDGDSLSETGLSKSAMLAYMEEKRMAGHMDKVVALVSSDKMAEDTGIPVFALDEIDIVITGKNAAPEMVALLKSKDIDVRLV